VQPRGSEFGCARRVIVEIDDQLRYTEGVNGGCHGYFDNFAGLLGVAQTIAPMWGDLKAVDYVDQYIDRAVVYAMDDSRNHWQTPYETELRRRGDCEDYAIAKAAVLHAAGYDIKLLHVTTSSGEAHMVATVSIQGVQYVLDNVADTQKLSNRDDLRINLVYVTQDGLTYTPSVEDSYYDKTVTSAE